MRIVFTLLLFACFVPCCVHAGVQAVHFPKTYEDVPFVDKVAIQTQGYKPFMDKSVYQSLDIVPGEEIYTDHSIAELECDNESECGIQDDLDDDAQSDVTETSIPGIQTVSVHHTEAQNKTYVGTVENQMQNQTPVVAYSGKTIGGGVVVENNVVMGGSCYLPDTDGNFPNKIYTTGRYEKISPVFEKAMITVFRKEGRCGTIKNDPCGYTCYGIGSSPKCSGVVVKTRAEAEDFYYNQFWKKYNYGSLPDVISGDVFLAGIASGPVTAIRQFSDFLGIGKRNSISNDMVQAVNGYNGDIHNRWLDKRDVFLQQVAKNRYNGSVSRGYKNAIILKRKNGCHVRPINPLTR